MSLFVESSIKIIYSCFIVFAALWAETNACINQTSGISCFVHLYLHFTYGKNPESRRTQLAQCLLFCCYS